MKKISILTGIILVLSCQFIHSQTKPAEYKLLKTIPVAGNGSWDYLTVDNNTYRLFISHGNLVDVLDLKTEKVIGQILNTPGVHGIACVREFNKGYITAGKLDSVIVFDLTTLAVLKKVKTDQNPDAIIYDPYTKKIFTFNGKGKSITAIDAKTDLILGTTALSGKPEFAVTNGKGKIFCNIEDKSTVVMFDTKTLKVDSEWPLKPGKEPTGLALDLVNSRLFAACSKSKQIVVLNSSNGALVDTIPIGGGCDGLLFITEDRTIISSNGDGTLTVVLQKDPNTYEVLQTLKTRKNARTITFGRMTRKMYLPCADISIENGKKKILPGTFSILVVGR